MDLKLLKVSNADLFFLCLYLRMNEDDCMFPSDLHFCWYIIHRYIDGGWQWNTLVSKKVSDHRTQYHSTENLFTTYNYMFTCDISHNHFFIHYTCTHVSYQLFFSCLFLAATAITSYTRCTCFLATTKLLSSWHLCANAEFVWLCACVPILQKSATFILSLLRNARWFYWASFVLITKI